MAEDNKDANTDTDSVETTGSDTDAGSSPDVELEAIEDFDGLVSTTEFKEVPIDKEIQETDTSEKTEHKIEDTKSKETPYHEDPRFQALIKEKNEYKETASKVKGLEAKIEKLDKGTVGKGYSSKILAMSAEDIIEKFTNNPHAIFKDFAGDIRAEVFREIATNNKTDKQNDLREASAEAEKGTLAQFFSDKSDGVKMLQDGSIQKFMKENPGHNAMSAYNNLSGAETISKSDSDKLVKDAVKEATKQLTKEIKAMGNAGSKFTTTSKKTVRNQSDEMKNPDKHGGPRAVAVKRFRERAAQ